MTCAVQARQHDRRRYPPRDVKLLFGYSAARCAFPGCGRLCIEPRTGVDRDVVTAVIAHIEAHSDGGPRSNVALTADERDCYGNWVLLCAEHHIIVDGQPNTYSVGDLRQWKHDLETWVQSQYKRAMPAVTFAELKVVSLALVNNTNHYEQSFQLTPPLEKMAKNGLTSKSEFLITLGIGKAPDVEKFVTAFSEIDSDFPERLKAGFVTRYLELHRQGFYGDDLFQALVDDSVSGATTFSMHAAALAVLTYMFAKCELFEP